jgi:FkbM family methyltransferase
VSCYLYQVRERFHPLNLLRRHKLSRAVLSAIDIPIWVKLPGVRWKAKVRLVRHASFFILSGGVEPGVSALFRAIGRQFGIQSFWDVGANVGYYSWLVKSIAPEAKVRMFEPDPDNLALLRKTMRRAELSEIVVREVAVSDARGRRRFARDEVSGSTGGIEENAITYSERHWGVQSGLLEVDTVSLDDEGASCGAVDLIKIDVEGHEEAVIRGALGTIRRDQPIVIFECFHGGTEIIRTLAPLGYSFIDADGTGGDLGTATDFLALPKRHSAALEELRCRWKDEAARV